MTEVVCSSQSACYLRNPFVQIHGQFQVPRTHGRIYDKWTLPDRLPEQVHMIKKITPVIELMNEALETKIFEALRQKRIPFSHPNESAVVIWAPWSSKSTVTPLPQTSANFRNFFGYDDCILENLDDTVRPLAPSGAPSCSAVVDETCAFPAMGRGNPSGECQENTSEEGSDTTYRLTTGAILSKAVKKQGRLRVKADGINLEFSVLSTSQDAEQNESERCLEIAVENVSFGCGESKEALEALEYDIDDLQPGCDTFIPVGTAAGISKLVLAKESYRVS